MEIPTIMGHAGGDAPPARLHLVVKLKPGWRWVNSKRAFISSSGQEFRPARELPSACSIEPMVPDLAAREEGQLSEDERNLARYIHIVFRKGAEPEKHSGEVRDWPCVEDVRQAPEISLP